MAIKATAPPTAMFWAHVKALSACSHRNPQHVGLTFLDCARAGWCPERNWPVQRQQNSSCGCPVTVHAFLCFKSHACCFQTSSAPANVWGHHCRKTVDCGLTLPCPGGIWNQGLACEQWQGRGAGTSYRKACRQCSVYAAATAPLVWGACLSAGASTAYDSGQTARRAAFQVQTLLGPAAVSIIHHASTSTGQ